MVRCLRAFLAIKPFYPEHGMALFRLLPGICDVPGTTVQNKYCCCVLKKQYIYRVASRPQTRASTSLGMTNRQRHWMCWVSRGRKKKTEHDPTPPHPASSARDDSSSFTICSSTGNTSRFRYMMLFLRNRTRHIRI